MAGEGFDVEMEYVSDIVSMKDSLGIPQTVRSCHTVKVGAYIVEGHVPVQAIKSLLEERPDIEGIALPGMPSGSPGMSGEKTGPFEVLAFTRHGSWLFAIH